MTNNIQSIKKFIASCHPDNLGFYQKIGLEAKNRILDWPEWKQRLWSVGKFERKVEEYTK